VAGSRKSAAEMRQMLRQRFPGKQGEILVQIFSALVTDIDSLETWGATLATKLNADAGVTDTNYDTTPTS
jgi:hypothetical protein